MKSNQIIFYSTPQGNIKVEVVFEKETFWLSQKRIADLFSVDVRTINEHLQNIYATGELQKRFNYPEISDSSKRRQQAGCKGC